MAGRLTSPFQFKYGMLASNPHPIIKTSSFLPILFGLLLLPSGPAGTLGYGWRQVDVVELSAHQFAREGHVAASV
jgi:hypothetical protein